MSTRQSLSRSAVMVLLAVACLVLGSVALAADPSGVSNNVLENGGFEDLADGVPTHWTRYASKGSREGFVVSTESRTGQYSLLFDVNKSVELSDSAVARLILGQTVDTSMGQPGKEYRFSIYYKTEGDPLGRLMIQGFPGGDLWATFEPAEDWTRTEITFVWPENEASFKFQIWVRDAVEGKLWIDDVEVVPID